MKKLAFLLCLNLLIGTSFAKTNDNDIAGTPITQNNVADVMEIQRIADAMSNAVDAKNWALVQSFMTDEITTSLGKAEPQTIAADSLIATFKKNLSDPSMNSQHRRTNQRVLFDGADKATMFSTGVIIVTKAPAEASGETLLIENWINYVHGFIKTPNGWKVNRILSDYVASRTSKLPSKAAAQKKSD